MSVGLMQTRDYRITQVKIEPECVCNIGAPEYIDNIFDTEMVRLSTLVIKKSIRPVPCVLT